MSGWRCGKACARCWRTSASPTSTAAAYRRTCARSLMATRNAPAPEAVGRVSRLRPTKGGVSRSALAGMRDGWLQRYGMDGRRRVHRSVAVLRTMTGRLVDGGDGRPQREPHLLAVVRDQPEPPTVREL